jgi:hypothetical protein
MTQRPSILIYIGRATTSSTGSALCIQAKTIVEQYRSTHDFVLVLARVKTAKVAKNVEQILNIKFKEIVLCRKEWSKHLDKLEYNNWFEFIEAEDWFGHIKHIEQIYVVGGLLSATAGINRIKQKLNALLHTKSFMRFDAIANSVSVTLQLIKFANANAIKLNEICYDPDEFSINLFTDIRVNDYKLYFPHYNMVRKDLLQTHFSQFIHKQYDKDIDFVFGGSFVTKARHLLYDELVTYLSTIESEFSVKSFVHNSKIKINTSVSYDEYIKHISRSKFTLIMRAYDPLTFSFSRFAEAIAVGCLPLIDHNVFIDDFIKSYEIDQEQINKLIVSTDSVLEAVGINEESRLSLIAYFTTKIFNLTL